MIYPIPQKMTKIRKMKTQAAFTLSGDCRQLAQKLFGEKNIPLSSDGFEVRIQIADCERTSYIKELSRLTDEKYFITVDESGALIDASCEKGVFRAINTLVRLILGGEMFEGSVEDYPAFEVRGYIEGFYGKTWEHETRISVMSLMAENGMNTFYYAPKDDIYHREKWSVFYPEKELGELEELFRFANENFMEFFWCIGPGLSYCYTSEEHFDLLIKKLMQLYDIGVRRFGLLLDDIPEEFNYDGDREKFGNIVYAHTDLVNRLYAALKKIDRSIKLTVCPTQYSGDEHGFYISKFGTAIPADVSVFWTGAEICSRVLTCREARELLSATGHKPLYWDNYPVNDCEMFKEMHINYIDGRDRKLYLDSEGLISNVMEYAECSKIPLLTICDYLWNPERYDKEDSLRNAHRVVLGERAELFGYFADNLGVSCLSRYSSPFMTRTLHRVMFLYGKGEKAAALEAFRAYLDRVNECNEMLGDSSVPLFAELGEWSRKFGMACDVLECTYAVLDEPTVQRKARLRETLDKYNADSVIFAGFCLRETAEKALAL